MRIIYPNHIEAKWCNVSPVANSYEGQAFEDAKLLLEDAMCYWSFANSNKPIMINLNYQ